MPRNVVQQPSKTATGKKNADLICSFAINTLFFMSLLWWARRDLNPQPRDYESPALTVELQALQH